MKKICPLTILFSYLGFFFYLSCTTSPKQVQNWENEVLEVYQQNRHLFNNCLKFFKSPSQSQIELTMTFRLNASGQLETLLLSESHNWNQAFYDCLFNTLDIMPFPANSSENSLEIVQPLILKRDHSS